MTTDAELLEAWATGDRNAANEMFERYFDPLYRFFRSKTSSNIEDLVQETFLAAVSQRERIRGATSFRAYLFGIARNLLFQQFRRRRVRGEDVDVMSHSVEDVTPGASTVLGEKQEHRLLADALRRIPIDHQIALELKYWEKLTGPEIAETLGLTEPAVRSRLRRAKEALKAEIERLASSAALVQSTWAGLEQWAMDIACELLPAGA